MYSNLAANSGSNQAILDKSQLPTDPAARRLRERYIDARFLQFPQPAQALRNTANVMRWAQQLIDDEQPRLAAELLHVALEEDGSQRPLWLFLIELAFLANDPATFSDLSDTFRQQFLDADATRVIDSMGHKLLPNDPRFAHAEDPEILPDWSTPETALRDELRQQKLHAALVEAMAYHQAR
ncbi:MAG: hypothetical protein LH481_09210 [Burkholderiales bacterium]|nr:hypothetical protein [Burkholderiales bacterium]